MGRIIGTVPIIFAAAGWAGTISPAGRGGGERAPLRHGGDRERSDPKRGQSPHWKPARDQERGRAGWAGNAQRGADIFFNKARCVACHRVGDVGGVLGPDLTAVGELEHPEYLRQSLVDPNAVVLPGYKANVMPGHFARHLSEREVDDVVAFLLTRRGRMEVARGKGAALDSEAGKPRGQVVYEKDCARCHGIGGKGDGPAARYLRPRPRDFTKGLFKIRSTGSGDLPMDEDLVGVVTRGMPGTAMIGWEALSKSDRRAVVRYLKGFVPQFKEAGPPPALVKVDGEVATTPESVGKGAAIYREMKCGDCHGEQGRADGMSAGSLVDDWGQPIRPADLTKPWTFRGGGSVRDIFLRLSTGMNGSPMPSFADSLPQQDRWHLANFVRSLGRAGRFGAPLVTGGGPVDVRLLGDVEAKSRMLSPTVTDISASARTDGKALELSLEWSDPTRTTGPMPDSLTVWVGSAVWGWSARSGSGVHRDGQWKVGLKGSAPSDDGTGIPIRLGVTEGDSRARSVSTWHRVFVKS